MRELKGSQPAVFEAIKIWLSLDGGGMYLLQGIAGTGKSFLCADIVWYIKQKGNPVVTSPTHKSLRVLKQFVGNNVDYFTIHAALGMKEVIEEDGKRSFMRDSNLGCPADEYTHIIIDEASMLDDSIFYELLDFVEQGKKILFIGDPMQIPPVNHEYSMPFNHQVRTDYNIGVSTLEVIIRQEENNPIIENAANIRTNIRNINGISQRQTVKNNIGEVSFIKRGDEYAFFTDNILPLYKSPEYDHNIDHVKVIGWRNKTVDSYNTMIRGYMFGENIPKIMVGDKLIADAPIFDDDNSTILISTNEEMEVVNTEIDHDHISEDFILTYYKTHVKVYNESDYNEYILRIIHEESEKTYQEILKLQKYLAKTHYRKGSFESRSAWIDYYNFIKYWHAVKYSYCVTAHKSQGSTYYTAMVLEYDIRANPEVFERNRILYTAATRPSKNLYIIY